MKKKPVVYIIISIILLVIGLSLNLKTETDKEISNKGLSVLLTDSTCESAQ